MRKSILTLAALATAVLAFGKAEAMPLGGLGQAADTLTAVEKTQFYYLRRDYCWYPDGWHGPGFYWCGYAWRSGFGWGGPLGWRGWHPRGGVVVGPRGGRAFVGPRGGVGVVGPRGGRAFVGPGGGRGFAAPGGGGRMGGGGGRGGGGGHRH
jgi:hypothetical protein